MSKVYTLQGKTMVSEVNDSLICFLDARKMRTLESFYHQMAAGLSFPDYFGENMDALDEMLYDLDWIDQESVLLVILNSEAFFSEELEKKSYIIELFQQVDNPHFEVCFA